MNLSSFTSFLERLKSVTPIQNQSQLANVLQVGRAAVSLAKHKDTVPSKWILILAQKYNLNSDWLATGKDTPYTSIKSSSQNSFVIKKVASKTNKDGTWQFINNQDLTYIHGQWLSERDYNTDKIVCLDMIGNCMEPEIKEGDTVVIDQSLTEIVVNKIFALGVEEMVIIRRLDKLPNMLLLHCENPNYPTNKLVGKKQNQIKVLGQVIGIVRRL